MFGRTSEWVEDANPMHAAPVKARNGNMVLAARVPASEQPRVVPRSRVMSVPLADFRHTRCPDGLPVAARMSLPYSLQPLDTYFTRADELSGPHPYVAHHLRLFAVELAMKMKGPDANQFLLTQMDILEKEKGSVEPPLYQPPLCPDPNWKPPPPPAPPEAPVAAAGAADASDGSNGSTADDGTAQSSDAKPEEAAASASSSKGMFSFLSKQPPKPSVDAAKEGVANLSIAGDPKPPPSDAPKPPMITPHKVAATPQQALRTLALDLYERGRQADKPDTFPSPSTSWGVSEAPKIARCLHASAVILDALKHFEPKLPAELERYQTAAHRRSVQLGGQINSAFKLKEGEPISLKWRPADMAAATPLPLPPPLFPSVPRS